MIKKNILFASFVALAANLITGLLLSRYQTFNLIATSTAIVATTLLSYAMAYFPLKDGFRIALILFYTAVGIIIFFLLLFTKPQVKDNFGVIVSIILMLAECVIAYTAYQVSCSDRK